MPVPAVWRPLASDPVPVTVEPDTITGLPAVDRSDAGSARGGASWIERLATRSRLAGGREEQPYAPESRCRQGGGEKQERPIHCRSLADDGFRIVATRRACDVGERMVNRRPRESEPPRDRPPPDHP
jgi:hypothetical protein